MGVDIMKTIFLKDDLISLGILFTVRGEVVPGLISVFSQVLFEG